MQKNIVSHAGEQTVLHVGKQVPFCPIGGYIYTRRWIYILSTLGIYTQQAGHIYTADWIY